MDHDNPKGVLEGAPAKTAQGRTITPPANSRTSRIPPPSIPSASRVSTPPPVPPQARASRAPPIPEATQREPSNPGISLIEKQKKELLALLREFYPEESQRIERNGNGYPALQAHLARMRDTLTIDMEKGNTFFFVLPMKWVALAATALALGAGGIALHSCSKANEAQQQLETQEKEIHDLKEKLEKLEKPRIQEAKPKPATSYIPKSLRNPPRQIPKPAPQKIARNSLRA